MIVNYSTGAIGVPIEKRIDYLRELRPDVAALNMSSMNYAKYSRRRKDFVFKAVFENSFDTIIEFLTAMRELGIKPEHECFDAGHVANLDPLLDMGLLDRAVADLAGDGRQRRHPADRPQRRASCPSRSPAAPRGPNAWQVIGISRDQWKLLGSALVARRQRPRRARGQPLPAERRDGALERRADRQGAPDGRGRRPAGGDGRPRRARCWACRSVPMSEPPLSDIRVLDLTRLLPGGFCSLLLADLGADVVKVEDTGMGDYVRWAPPYYGDDSAAAARHPLGALSGAQPRQALDPARPQVRARPRRVPARWSGGPTSSSRASGPGVLDRLGVGYEAPARGEPADRLLRDHRVRPVAGRTPPAPATT